jgi:uncharacterized protein (TIGR02246 family)
MEISDQLVIEQLLSDFAWFADRGDGEALARLFLPDAILIVGGTELVGRQRIADDCFRRFNDPHRKTRHVWSNLRIEHSGADSVTTTAVQMTFEQSAPDIPTQLRVNDLFDEFRRDADKRWRIARRTIKREIALALPR